MPNLFQYKKINKKILSLILILVVVVTACFFFSHPLKAEGDEEILKSKIQKEIDNLDNEINEKQKNIEELNKQREYYQKSIETKRKEILSLNNQLSIIEDRQARAELNIKTTQVEIEKTELEVKNIELQIIKKEDEIKDQKSKLGEIIRLFYLADQKSLLEIILTNDSLSEFFNQIKYSEDLQESLQKNLDKLEMVKQGLVVQRNDLNTKKQGLEELKINLGVEKDKLQQEEAMKVNILSQTRGVEQKFQNILWEIQKEWNQAQAEISNLERTARDKLYQQKELGGELWTGGKLSWPVPNNGITCNFHDPEYPFRRWIGEHSGIDIRSPQGSPVYATGPGYVARTKDAGMGYSYIMLIHNDNTSTVYGHISKIIVAEDSFVTRGQVIAYSGGLPGTSGAGHFSTGPHLHFEVRVGGIPVNPLEYLM